LLPLRAKRDDFGVGAAICRPRLSDPCSREGAEKKLFNHEKHESHEKKINRKERKEKTGVIARSESDEAIQKNRLTRSA
jgi:hypothetical protein